MTETKIYVDEHMEVPDLFQLATGMASVFSSRSPDKDTPNEDSAGVVLIDKNSSVLIVADGAGGARAGNQASSIAVATIKESVERAKKQGSEIRFGIIEGIEEANKKILDLGIGAATTLAVVEITDNIIRPYHVGDSFIISFGQQGKLKLETVAHSPVGYGIESGLLDAEDAMHHEERHIVSNLVGTPDMRIEIGSAFELAKRDTVLIASDGLSDNLHIHEVIEAARNLSLEEAAELLVENCHERMTAPRENEPSKPDDLTFILFRPA